MPDLTKCTFDIILIIDESGSMRQRIPGGDYKYRIADKILEQFIRSLPDNARMAIVDYDTKGEELIGLSSRAELLQKLAQLQQQTGHSGNTAISSGIAIANTIKGNRDANSNPPIYTIAITDGLDNTGVGGSVDFLVQVGKEVPSTNIKFTYQASSAADALGVVTSIYELACPSPKEVPMNFIAQITPPVPSSGLTWGDIILDGVFIGRSDVTKQLLEGSTHRVVFTKPSHPDYIFKEGVPPAVNFTVPIGGGVIKSIFTHTKVPSSYLTINTTYDPVVDDSNLLGEIYLNGSKPLNIAVPDNPDSELYLVGTGKTAKMRLTPGRYTISFKDITIPGLKYTTPAPFIIDLKSGDDLVETREYLGEYLPDIFWLKPIDDVDCRKLHSKNTVGMFSNNIGNLLTYYTSSLGTSLDNHYTHVYHEPSGSVTGSIQFSLAYGHYHGSGSNDQGGQYNDTPTRAIYGQYRNILLGNATGKFNLSGADTEHFYAISYQKDRRDAIADYEALEVNIAHLSGSEFINGSGTMRTHTGSNVQLSGTDAVLRLISDSSVNPYPSSSFGGDYFNVVSGSIEDGVYNHPNVHTYGKLYPSHGVILLDADKLDTSASFGTVTTRELDANNQLKVFTAISGAALFTDASGDYLGMKARARKLDMETYYYINARNKEFNFTNNPSYYDLDSGDIISDFYKDNKTYITTIGLYDVDRNLLAVAKTSVPELKSFTDEVIYTVKLKH